MENTINSLNIALYLLKYVQVNFNDSSTKRGILSNYDPITGILQIDEETIPVDVVVDIEFVSTVDDFHTYKGYGEIGKIKFTADDLRPDFDLTDLLYGEYDCTVSCHLYLKDGEICAKDIRLLEKSHLLNYDCAKNKSLIYRYDNGEIVIGTISGTFQEYQITTLSGESRSLDLNHITDVTKAPEVNDYMYLYLSSDTLEHSGLVSAINGTTIVLINSNGFPEVIDLIHSTAIRYRGTVRIKKTLVNGKTTRRIMIATGTSNDDDGYLCKSPYARNPETIAHVQDGDVVSFVAGINGRYFIAKDVDVIQSEPKKEKESTSEDEFYGIILTVDFVRDNGYGYVGNRFVSKACGQSVPGNARFNRNQLDFKIGYNKTYIVKYTATENEDGGLRIISQLSLYQVIDSTKFGIVEVSNDGQINTIPLYKAGITHYENRDVDVYTTDGRITSGKLCSYSDTGVSICSGHKNDEEATSILFSDIDDIRIIGTVSQYYPNGTGYVDNTFFFHIDKMEKSIDAQHIRRGIQVSFCLINGQKGNRVGCGSIRLLPEKSIEAYVLSYQNQKYFVVNADKYGRSIHFFNDAYEIPYFGYNAFRDLSNEDYHAIFTIQRRNGLEECTNIRTLDASPKLRYGIVTSLNRESKTVSIISSANYRKNSNAVQYPLSLQGRIDRITNPERKDYQVLYYTTVQNNIPVATIVLVESKDVYEKCFFGYIEQYFEDRAYGWITPEEYIGTPWKDRPKNFGVYCRHSAFVENQKPIELYNPGSILRVCYTLDFGFRTSSYSPKAPAKNVWVLEKIVRPKYHNPDPVPTPKPVPKPIQVQKRTEIRNIAEMSSPSTAFSSEQYEYGLINVYRTGYALINSQYYNRNHAPEWTYDMNQTVYFVPDEVTIIPDTRIKTVNSYLVRYVRKGTRINPSTGLEQPTVDNSYPIEVVCAFPKKRCSSIVLNGEEIAIEYIGEKLPEADSTSNDAPELMIGESIFFEFKDGSACHGVYSGEDDDSFFLSSGDTINKNLIANLFRFGVISALSIENGTATINNHFDFNLTVADAKMLSILKNQKNLVRLHVMYSCVEGKITEVCRVSKRCLSCLVWEPGIVTELNNETHSLTIDSSIRHYLSVMSDGVNVYVNNGTILNRAVYVKQVFHPYLGANEVEPGIMAFAVDVRCQEEELRIQYDEGRDIYLGYRNATISFPVLGSVRVLSEKIGETIPVMFRVSSDMYNLEGYIDDGSEPTEEPDLIEEYDSTRISHEPLAQLLLQREDVDQLRAGKIFLNADSDQGQVQRAVDFFISKSKHLAAIKTALAYPEYDVLAKTESLFRSEMQKKCTTVCFDPNSYYGEQAFYIATVLQYPTFNRTRGRNPSGRFSSYDYLYRLFSQDFESRELMVKYLQNSHPAGKANLVNMFRKPCLQIGELVAHIILLDKRNFESICSMIQNTQQLSEEIIVYAKEVDDTISEQDITAVISALQDRYSHDKRRFSGRIIALINRENICEDLRSILLNMQSRFMKLMCKEDTQRFESLLRICTDVLSYANKPGFAQQEQQLLRAYQDISLMEEDIIEHPCKESLEILLNSGRFDIEVNVLTTIKHEIFSILNRLYKDASKPRIQCRVNENTILPGAKTFWLIVENGSQNDNLQPAENLQIELEPFTFGFMPQTRVHLLQHKLSCGEQMAVEVEFDLSGDVSGVLEFGWVARYEYTTEFLKDGSTKSSVYLQESEQPLHLQINTGLGQVKNYAAVNPYAVPAHGEPLTSKKMFYGRETEKREILDYICNDGNEKSFIPGRAVIIYGQKKSGKTSLVNQIKNLIREDKELSDKAILLNFGNILGDTGGEELLHCFNRNFYNMIMSRFEDEVFDNHPDIAELMDRAGLEIPDLLSERSTDIWASQFDKFFRDFARIDAGRHQIILFMDEFTRLCTTILSKIKSSENISLASIPNFIKTFSQYGFIQIIIGHEAMMRVLDTLGVRNHTAEFTKSIEISALDEDASRALIVEPMQDKEVFGYNVYETELGKRAVEWLLDLSGRSPVWLMKLCDQMFVYYEDSEKCPRTQLYLSDVESMLEDYISELLLEDFEILMREDGDGIGKTEDLITYHYLKNAAMLSFTSYDRRTADSGEIARTLAQDYGYSLVEIDKTRNLLDARRVISITSGGRVKINTWLFAVYAQRKSGLK